MSTLAEQMIDQLIEYQRKVAPKVLAAGKDFVKRQKKYLVKSEELSGREVAALQPKERIIVNGKKGVVLTVKTIGSMVELVWMKGVKSFKENYLSVELRASKSGVKLIKQFSERDLNERMTRGVHNALSRGRVKEACPHCGIGLPVYVGRYPNQCFNCGEGYERAQVL